MPSPRRLAHGPAVTDRRYVLGVFYGLGAALLGVVVVAPSRSDTAWPVLASIAVVAGATSAAVLLATRLPRRLAHGLCALGSGLVSVAVVAARGGVPSAAVAMFSGWVVIWAALFLPRRAAWLQALLAVGLSTVALFLVEPAVTAAMHATLLVVVDLSTGLIVADLIRHTTLLSTRDALTGLLNESGLARVVAASVADWAEGDTGLLLLIDLDRFGELNQALGRPGGDDLLRQVAHAYEVNGRGHATVARLGGDDFAFWLPNVPEAAGDAQAAQAAVELVAGMIVEDSSGPFVVNGVGVELEFTVGAALVPQHGADLELLLQRADVALHAARTADRPALLWDEEMDQASGEDVALHSELRAAVTDGQLRLHYQPLVDAHDQRIVGVEALVRWEHPRMGLLGPATFLPAAERSSVIVPLTAWVLGEALRQAAVWHAAGRPLRVSVNLSARLVSDDRLPATVAAALAARALPADLLVLEVTESAVTAQPRRAAAVLAQLRDIGVRIALDDFGTGCTSLAMLQDLPFDELKVDQRFVSGALTRAGDRAIVHTVVDLGHRLGFEVVGEGVEDDQTRQLLTELGYDLLQGYHFSRPVPAAQIDVLRARAAPAPRWGSGPLPVLTPL